jgi:hypothetical protein
VPTVSPLKKIDRERPINEDFGLLRVLILPTLPLKKRSQNVDSSEHKPQAEVEEEDVIVVDKEAIKEWIAKFELLKEFKTIYGDYKNVYDSRVTETEERFKGLMNFVLAPVQSV